MKTVVGTFCLNWKSDYLSECSPLNIKTRENSKDGRKDHFVLEYTLSSRDAKAFSTFWSLSNQDTVHTTHATYSSAATVRNC